jgi:LmbE family N-acetylglucosaminyl deacetylase
MGAAEELTLMVVHAHPDDEASSTGGILAKYSAEGVRTVLVTCTDGAQGDAPGGLKPDDDGHDENEVVDLRIEELRRSCEVLGVRHLELLGYRDSGMMGWPSNDAPGSFWTTPIEPVAGRLVGLFERYRPQVVVTYDPTGFYGHPDHIQTHRVTAAAFEASPIPRKLYCPTIPRSRFAEFGRVLAEAGLDIGPDRSGSDVDGNGDGDGEGDGASEDPGVFTSDDDDIAAVIDCARYADRKLAALGAHKSQADNVFFLRLPEEVFRQFFGIESFVRWWDRTGHPAPEKDLFAGLR